MSKFGSPTPTKINPSYADAHRWRFPASFTVTSHIEDTHKGIIEYTLPMAYRTHVKLHAYCTSLANVRTHFRLDVLLKSHPELALVIILAVSPVVRQQVYGVVWI